MTTMYYDARGFAHNGRADWWWHMPSSGGRVAVYVSGITGWTEDRLIWATTDDFGTLVRAQS